MIAFVRLAHQPGHDPIALFKSPDSVDLLTPTMGASAIHDFMQHDEHRLHFLCTLEKGDFEECVMLAAHAAPGLSATALVADRVEASALEHRLLIDGQARPEPGCLSFGAAVVAIAVWGGEENLDAGSVLVVAASLAEQQNAIVEREATRAPRKSIFLHRRACALVVE